MYKAAVSVGGIFFNSYSNLRKGQILHETEETADANYECVGNKTLRLQKALAVKTNRVCIF